MSRRGCSRPTRCGRDYVVVVEVPVEPPWPKYDDFDGTPEELVVKIGDLGYSYADALEYERVEVGPAARGRDHRARAGNEPASPPAREASMVRLRQIRSQFRARDAIRPAGCSGRASALRGRPTPDARTGSRRQHRGEAEPAARRLRFRRARRLQPDGAASLPSVTSMSSGHGMSAAPGHGSMPRRCASASAVPSSGECLYGQVGHAVLA